MGLGGVAIGGMGSSWDHGSLCGTFQQREFALGLKRSA